MPSGVSVMIELIAYRQVACNDIAMQLPNHCLWNAFRDGCAFDTQSGSVVLRCVDAGALAMRSGRIAACDLVDLASAEPFSIELPSDHYPVFLSISSNDGVALSMIQFEDKVPTHWLATRPSLFSVDSSITCLTDASLARKVKRFTGARSESLLKSVEDAIVGNDDIWANVPFGTGSDLNLIAFRTFGGDGTFASYLGCSESGRHVCLVTDYFLGDCAIAPI